MRKTTQLKSLIQSKNLEFIMEAHNGLSAKIVEEAGFKGIWGSGLTLSAGMGVRDNNEASWTQVLEVVEFMSDASSIPILLDGDTGYGNFNNVRRLVKKLEQRGIAGVCIEDKLFPKTNSFIGGETQDLADIHEFSGKIKAAKDTQNDPDFQVVARIEAFIAGKGLEEALKRAEAYHRSGADALLIHSKRGDANEIESFIKHWKDKCPVIIVPTKYYAVPTEAFIEMGISLIIWANHNLRASIQAMQTFSKKLYEQQSLKDLEQTVVSVSEVFRIQGSKELEDAETRYLPNKEAQANAIVLAASQGGFYELTKEKPKALLDINGKSILDHQTTVMRKLGITDIAVVRGFGKEAFTDPDLTYIDNTNHYESKDGYSLYLALKKIIGPTLIAYGDILYKDYVLQELLDANEEITICVDADIEFKNKSHDIITASEPYNKKNLHQTVLLKNILESSQKTTDADGEFIGLVKVSESGAKKMKAVVDDYATHPQKHTFTLVDVLNTLSKTTPIHIKYIKGSWLDIDSIVDLQRAQTF